MKQLPTRLCLTFIILTATFCAHAQSSRIEWARDTISKADAIGGKDTYVNTIRGSGQLATEKIALPVDKMKEIFDACYANNITDITVMFVAIRQVDIARFKNNHPEIQATNSQLKGRQMLVFKVPRRAFAAKSASAGAMISKDNAVLLSLSSLGLVQLSASLLDIPAAGEDIYFTIGTICPPPASCDL